MQPTLFDFLYWLSMAAVAINALTGVLDAGRKQMDVVGVVMVGCVAALGGGTVRDLLLQRPSSGSVIPTTWWWRSWRRCWFFCWCVDCACPPRCF